MGAVLEGQEGLLGGVDVVGYFARGGAEISEGDAQGGQVAGDAVLEVESGVIGSQGDFHGRPSRRFSASTARPTE